MASDLEDLRREIDIVDIISEYIPLERVGVNYRARCPFHPDRTPSFYVSPLKGIFKCFGCGVGGDAIKFVSLYENIPYFQAAVEIAKKYGIKLKLPREEKVDSETLLAISKVAEFYHRKLAQSREALEYLKTRSIEKASIKRFLIGFSASSEELVNFLRKEGILDHYLKSGNLKKVGEDSFVDLFKGRITFAVRNERGDVVGFGGRILEGNGPKYVNSPDSPFFKKSHLLFGLYEGLSYLKDFKSAILVEGYFDVVSLHQEGFKNAVATLGTAFNENHAKVLKKYVSKVYLLFDGDEAGRKALDRTIPFLLSQDLEVFPVFLPAGKDPHDFVRDEGPSALQSLIDDSREIFEGIFAELKDPSIRKRALERFLKYIPYVQDPVKMHDLVSEASKLTGIPHDALAEKIKPVKSTKVEENSSLPVHLRIFLKGLKTLKVSIDLDTLDLPYKVKSLAEGLLRGEVEELPQEVEEVEVPDLEERFWKIVEDLSVRPDEEVDRRGLRKVILSTSLHRSFGGRR